MRNTRKRSKTNRWSRSEEKEKYWREHVSAWRNSGLSVRAYCQQHDVIETSFYAWRRELAIRERETSPRAQSNSKAVVKDSRGRSIPTHFAELEPTRITRSETQSGTGWSQLSGSNPFVAMKLVQNEEKADKRQGGSSTELTITTPRGFSVQLSSTIDIELLKTVIQALEECKC